MRTSQRVLLGRRSDFEQFPMRRFNVEGHVVLVVALKDELVAIEDTCSHANASLAEEGEVDSDAREIECCRHGARFSLDDGSALSLPATSGLRTYRVVTENDSVFIEIR